jgi:Tfp pilus assembly protein PilF
MKRLAVVICLASCGGLVGGREGDTKKSDSRLELAKEYLNKQELEAAEAEANKSIAYLPTNEDAFVVRGLVHYLRALNARRLMEIDDCLAGLQAEVFDEDLETQLTAARKDFETAARLAPDYGEAWANLGVVANLLGAYDEAIEHLTRALENPMRLTNPGLARANLGWAYFQKEDYLRAAKELLQVKQFAPSHCVPTYRLGRVYFARGEWENAAQEFMAVDPSCGLQEANLYLMKTRIEQGLVDEAKDAQGACLALSPKSCVARQCRSAGAF